MSFPITLGAISQLASRTSARWAKTLSMLLVLLTGLSVCAARANADSIKLISVTTFAGETEYMYVISTTVPTLYAVDDTITFKNIPMLAGGGEGLALTNFALSTSGNTATFIAELPISLAADGTYEFIDIISFSPNMGLIHYVSTSDPAFSGVVEGPGPATTPEPSSILLFGSAILTLMGITLRSKRLA
jgi:hypothetical protein